MEPQGIFLGTGEPGTGKTTWALTAYPIKKTAYLYDDIKKLSIGGMDAQELKKEFGLFVDLIEKYPVTKFKLLEYYQTVKKEIDNIPDNAYDSIIFDTWSRTGKAIRNYAKVNPLEFREFKTFSTKGSFKGPQEWNEAAVVENAIVSQLSRKCKALFIIAHVKPVYKGGSVVDEVFEADIHHSFKKICNASFWFRPNSNSGVPITLVLKRMSKIELKDGMIQPVNLLPRKITPLETETSVWQSIQRYWDNPVGNRKPTEDEIPNEFEHGILTGTLTESQKQMWQVELRTKKEQKQQEQAFFDDQMNEIKKEVVAWATESNLLNVPPLVFAHFAEKYPNLKLEEIEEMLK